MCTIVQRLEQHRDLSDEQLAMLLETAAYDHCLYAAADRVRRAQYGTDVYLRGLIECTNVCKNNCYYCGIRRDNRKLHRYRLTPAEILDCCRAGYALGFRTFVLQGGEDPVWADDASLCAVISAIRETFPDCAITLSLGERSRASYRALYRAGADRYLLRHETASDQHYRQLHPPELSLAHRKQCLYDLRAIGYQVGSGFLVGSPFQTTAHLIQDLRFLQQLQPDMIGIGPFLPHGDTPFGQFPPGDLFLTVRLLAILRLMFPEALIPATTALNSVDPRGREMGLKAGANVIMPNLSPSKVRQWYALYEGKRYSGAESAQQVERLRSYIQQMGYTVVTSRGDRKAWKRMEWVE